MHPHSPLADTLLRHLGREEALLRTALANVTAIHAALRGGDLATALGISTQTLAAELRGAADRSAAATALARELGLGEEPVGCFNDLSKRRLLQSEGLGQHSPGQRPGLVDRGFGSLKGCDTPSEDVPALQAENQGGYSEAATHAAPVTLAALAAKLPEPHAAELLAVRARLAAVTAELSDVQARNANLITHLRSYFRGVLSELTAPEAPLRYGPSGSRLEPGTGVAVPARITS